MRTVILRLEPACYEAHLLDAQGAILVVGKGRTRLEAEQMMREEYRRIVLAYSY